MYSPYGIYDSLNNTPSPTAYRYRPLESENHIRLLCLQTDKDTLTCEIVHKDIKTDPPFEALSYVWGDDTKSHRMAVDSGQQCIFITKSLHDALKSLCSDHTGPGPRVIWADGVCLNQDDREEKEQQIPLMGAIYRQATQVITYIGELTYAASRALSLADLLHKRIQEKTGKDPDLEVMDLDRLEQLGLPHKNSPSWRHLRELLRRPWSTRAWIVQEFVLNRNVSIYCGGRKLPWDYLIKICAAVAKGHIPSLASMEDLSDNVSTATVESMMSDASPNALLQNFEAIHGLRMYCKTQGPLNLLQTLKFCHRHQCRAPQDKVYSVLGLASDAVDFSVRPDCSLTMEEVYLNIATKILQSEEGLELLSSVLPSRSETLPSWVPDWSSCRATEGQTLVRSGILAGLTPYNACGASRAKAHARFDTSSTRLTLTGIVVDRIEHLSDRLGSEISPMPQHWPRNQQWVEYYARRVFARSRYGGDSSDAFWRTLIANFTSMGEIAPMEYVLFYQAWYQVLCTPPFTDPQGRSVLDPFAAGIATGFVQSMALCAMHRRLCFTYDGYIGLAPLNAQVGDIVTVLDGGLVPFILRKREGSEFQLVGEAYIHGLMQGEAAELKEQTISLV